MDKKHIGNCSSLKPIDPKAERVFVAATPEEVTKALEKRRPVLQPVLDYLKDK